MNGHFLFWWAVRGLGRRRKLVLGVVGSGVLATVLVCGALLAAYESTREPQGRIGGSDWQLLIAPATNAIGTQRSQAAVDAIRAAADHVVVSGSAGIRAAGTVGEFQVSNEDPGATLSGRPFTVLAGRAPGRIGEAGLTEFTKGLLEATLGRTLGPGSTIDLGGGRTYRVTGILRDPGNWGRDQIVLPRADLSALARATNSAPPVQNVVASGLTQSDIDPLLRDHRRIQFAEQGTRAAIPGLDLAFSALAAVMLVLAALLAGLSFSASTTRTMHDYGLLASVGASPRQVAAVVPLFAAGVGVAAALLGVAVSLATQPVQRGFLAALQQHDLPAASAPAALFALGGIFVATAIWLGAWLPAFRLLRAAPADALTASQRTRSGSRFKRASAILFVAAANAGPQLLTGTPRLVGSTLAAFAAALLLLAPAMRALAKVRGHRSFVTAMGWREAFGADGSTATAALFTAVLSVLAVGAGLAQSSAIRSAASLPRTPANVAVLESEANDAFVEVADVLPAAVRTAAAVRAQLPATLADATIAPIEFFRVEGANHTSGGRRPVAVGHVTTATPPRVRQAVPLWRASPSLATAFGISIPPRAELATAHPDRAPTYAANDQAAERRAVTTTVPVPDASLVAPLWATDALARQRGWEPVTGGWIVSSRRPLTDEETIQLEALGARTGLRVGAARQATSVGFVDLPLLASSAGLMLALLLGAVFRSQAERLASTVRQLETIGTPLTGVRRIVRLRFLLLAILAGCCALGVNAVASITNHLASESEPPIVLAGWPTYMVAAAIAAVWAGAWAVGRRATAVRGVHSGAR